MKLGARANSRATSGGGHVPWACFGLWAHIAMNRCCALLRAGIRLPPYSVYYLLWFPMVMPRITQLTIKTTTEKTRANQSNQLPDMAIVRSS